MLETNCGNAPDPELLTAEIGKLAVKAGFSAFGISHAVLPEPLLAEHESRIERGLTADLDFLRHYLPANKNPDLILPGAVSIISLALACNPGYSLSSDGGHVRFSVSSLGRDYHKTVKKRLTELVKLIDSAYPGHNFRTFADSGPIIEKGHGFVSGLGGIGKNSLIVDKNLGSRFCLGEIITDMKLSPTSIPPADEEEYERLLKARDPCGACDRCVKSCPTGAILAGRNIDAARCISYLTFELDGPIPKDIAALMGNRVSGCDACQDCCPYNRRAPKNFHPDFACRFGDSDLEIKNMLAHDEASFRAKFTGTQAMRVGYERMMRNSVIAAFNSGIGELIEAASSLEGKISELVDAQIAIMKRKQEQ